MVLKIIKKPAEAKAEDKAVDKAEKNTKAVVSEGQTGFTAIAPMCMVGITVQYSHKMPNEDWVKVGIKLEVPAEHAKIDEVYNYVKEWTDTKLNAAVAEITAE